MNLTETVEEETEDSLGVWMGVEKEREGLKMAVRLEAQWQRKLVVFLKKAVKGGRGEER